LCNENESKIPPNPPLEKGGTAWCHMKNGRKSIALLGGNFDPVHYGHIQIGKTILEQLPIDQVWFVPAGVHPQKQETMFTFSQRIKFLKEALRDIPDFHIYENDVRDSEKSYTIYLIKDLYELYPEYKFYFIIGADNVEKLHTWYKYEELLELIDFIVINRGDDGGSKPTHLEYFDKLSFVTMPQIDISSSEIRETIERSIVSDRKKK